MREPVPFLDSDSRLCKRLPVKALPPPPAPFFTFRRIMDSSTLHSLLHTLKIVDESQTPETGPVVICDCNTECPTVSNKLTVNIQYFRLHHITSHIYLPTSRSQSISFLMRVKPTAFPAWNLLPKIYCRPMIKVIVVQ